MYDGKIPGVFVLTATVGEIFESLEKPTAVGDPASLVEVVGATHDSRMVRPGWAFVALRGDKVDGHRFISDAVERGASLVVAEMAPDSIDSSTSVPAGNRQPIDSSTGVPAVERSPIDSSTGVPAGVFETIVNRKSAGAEAGSTEESSAGQQACGRKHSGPAWITVDNSREALGIVSAVVYGRPTSRMALVGITGTNGKTTLTYLLESIIKAWGGSPGIIGTINYRWDGKEFDAARTTPEASDLQRILAEMVSQGVTHGIMEVSSHGLHRGRANGCHFDVGVFTNLTQDHLDYHGTFEEYYQAKKLLFSRLLANSEKTEKWAVVNLDDEYGRRLFSELSGLDRLGYGMVEDAQVRPFGAKLSSEGISGRAQCPGGTVALDSRLTGTFNLSNLLAAVAVADRLGIPPHIIGEGISKVASVPGRLERVVFEDADIFVDYAHTPNALKNVLSALSAVKKGRMVTLIGCGGDRDKAKRSLMGMEAAAGSDFVVITSDNPRSEDPLEIINQVEQGVRGFGFKGTVGSVNGDGMEPGHYAVIPERRRAIAWAVRALKPGDTLLVAGKGHETYQEIRGVRHPFDDRQVLREELAGLAGDNDQ
jgi:UDP-N-acetylmuramoyl-L-alanyl-D-glutamate--2,6-diaminopimelate ligase